MTTQEKLPEPSNPLGIDGLEFVEYATSQPQQFGALLQNMGFAAVARHRSREVMLYRQGGMNLIVNAHEGFVHLVVAENQAKGRHLRKSKVMRTLNRPIIDRLARVIERGQAAGVFRAGIDPVEIHKAIAALGMFNVTNQFTFGAIFQREMGSKGDVKHRREIVADLIISYLKGGETQ